MNIDLKSLTTEEILNEALLRTQESCKEEKPILLLVDVQNDFMPYGALPVPGGNEIIGPINHLIKSGNYVAVIATQDWHPSNHGSFAVNHGALFYSVGELDGHPQVLWPAHCVQGTTGAELHPVLDTRINAIVRKGMNPLRDSYSGIRDNYTDTMTGLDALLGSYNTNLIHVVGLATDYCVKATVIDLLRLGFEVSVLLYACRGVDPASTQAAIDEMRDFGANIVTKPF